MSTRGGCTRVAACPRSGGYHRAGRGPACCLTSIGPGVFLRCLTEKVRDGGPGRAWSECRLQGGRRGDGWLGDRRVLRGGQGQQVGAEGLDLSLDGGGV